VDLAIFNGPGWTLSGGPWVKPSQSMRSLVLLDRRAPKDVEDAQEVATIAFPVPRGYQPWPKRAILAVDPKVETFEQPGHTGPLVIDIRTPDPFRCRGLLVR